jgi:hypothetical protein
MRIKEIYTYKRPKIPFFNEVFPGEEMSFKIIVYCTRDEMKKLTQDLPQAVV